MRRRYLWLAVALAVLIVALGLVFFLTRDNGGGPTTIGPKTVNVDGKTQWTSTRIALKVGDDVSISASGTVFPNKTNRAAAASPDGVPNQPGLRQFNLVPSADHSGLIGRVGDDGPPFAVGHELHFRASTAGPLELGINDTGVFDNDGSFVARVTVTRK